MIEEYSPKHPDSEEFFTIDFSPDLADGDALASLLRLTITVGDDPSDPANLVTSTAAPAGLQSPFVTWFGTKGKAGKRYTVTAEARTASGELLVKSGSVYISKQV